MLPLGFAGFATSTSYLMALRRPVEPTPIFDQLVRDFGFDTVFTFKVSSR